MRVKAHWFRGANARTPDEIAGAVAFIAFRVARNTLESMRKAGFDIDTGAAYFEFLAEALACAIQCACRIAWPRLAEPDRMRFATALSQRAAGHLADNQAELLGDQTPAEIRAAFIDRLNRRFAEYADLDYGADGPSFAFLRYFASLVAERVPEKDRRWTHDQVMTIEGPEIAATLAKSLAALAGEDTGRSPRRAAALGE